MTWNAAAFLASHRADSEDRAEFWRLESGGLLLALADGAGGTPGGARAAEWIVRKASLFAKTGENPSASACRDLLARAEQGIEFDPLAGWTTGIVAFVSGGRVEGASVGDSGAWLVHEGEALDLAANQRRRPLIGDGGGFAAVEFSAETPPGAALLIASDGVFNYAPRDRLIALAEKRADLEQAVRDIVEASRPARGGWMDDAGAILCRQDSP